jgi:N-acetylglutamate synthase-like GNAT family acetyltransferase
MVTIRRCETKDHGAVKALVTQIMNEEFGESKKAYPMDDVDHLEKAYGGFGEAFFVAEDNHKIVGTVGIKKEDERVALLRRLFVSPAYRGRQIGSKLIDRALEFCEEVGYEEIVFKTTSQMVGAIKTCQKKGFIQRAKLNLAGVELFKFSRALHPRVKSPK